MSNFFEGLGGFAGKKIVAPILERQREKIETFDFKVTGEENLRALKGIPFILVANHLQPQDSSAQQSQLSPDAFVLEKLVKDINDQELKIVSKCDDGWWAENAYRYFQKYAQQPFGKGMMKSLGFVPIYKNPGSFNKDFMKLVDTTIQQDKNPLLIFPEGHWQEDFDPKNKLEDGASYIAKKYNLPLLPAYIRGATKWEPGTEVKVSFGESFNPQNLNREQITEEIKGRLSQLQKEMI